MALKGCNLQDVEKGENFYCTANGLGWGGDFIFTTVDVLRWRLDKRQIPAKFDQEYAILEFLKDMARNTKGLKAPRIVKLILSSKKGYILRSDLLKLRMTGCPGIAQVRTFVTPGQYVRGYDGHDGYLEDHEYNDQRPSLAALLPNVIGALVLADPVDLATMLAIKQVKDEMLSRLSCPWVTSEPLTRKRLVIVGHRHPAVMAGYLASAAALGIRVTLVDGLGEFLPEAMRSNCVESCIAIDMTADVGLSARIVDGLNATSIEFHGITSFTDTWLVHVAEAALAMGLPTPPLEAVKLCLDKHATRLLCPNEKKAIRVKRIEDVQSHLAATTGSLNYPLLVKPCTAWGSQGVFKVDDEEQLSAALIGAKTAAKDSDLLIDEYIAGPEVDANFVLINGMMYFFELVDGLPCTAEALNENGKSGNFLETDEVWPTNHPREEVDMIRSEMRAMVVGAGFLNGVFHVEARVRDSRMKYTVQDGVCDLRPSRVTRPRPASAFLLEINQRPPGHGGSQGASLASGIDYPALHMLCALDEKEMLAALSKPFQNNAQRWVNACFINTDAQGVFEHEDICQSLRKMRPDLMEHVQYSKCYYQPGETISEVPARLALFIVTSTESRLKVRKISQEIREVARSICDCN